MESKVSEGGLNVTLTIRLLMHGKVRGAAIVSIGKVAAADRTRDALPGPLAL